jgi:hypothetical protein
MPGNSQQDGCSFDGCPDDPINIVARELSQHCERSPAHVLHGKAKLAQQDIAGRRRAETVDAQHIAVIAHVAMPAL